MQQQNKQIQSAPQAARIWPLVVLFLMLIAIPIGVLAFRSVDQSRGGALTGAVKKGLLGMSSALVAPLEEKTETTAEDRIIAAAETGVARYKTFTNKDNYENIRAMRPIVTERWWKKLDELITQEGAKQKSGDTFYGIVTTVVGSRMTSKDIDTAEIHVQTSREEVKGLESSASASTQTFTVQLKREQTSWLIDSITP